MADRDLDNLPPLWIVIGVRRATHTFIIMGANKDRDAAKLLGKDRAAQHGIDTFEAIEISKPVAFCQNARLWLAELGILGVDNQDAMKVIGAGVAEMLEGCAKATRKEASHA